MVNRLIRILLVVIALIALAIPYIAGAGMVAVDDEELADITAQTGVIINANLKATSGNLIVGGTAGTINFGSWYLNSAATGDSNPTSGNEGQSHWGPVTMDLFTSGGKSYGAIMLQTSSPYPTWIFKSVKIKNAGSSTWKDIGGLYLTGINLVGGLGNYILLFNDESRSSSQIQANGRFQGSIDRVVINWNSEANRSANYLTDDCFVISNLRIKHDNNAGSMELGGTTFTFADSAAPFTWDQTGNYLNYGTTNSRIWFPLEGSLYWDDLYIRSNGATGHHLGAFGLAHAYGGTITIDFEQRETGFSSGPGYWWQY